MAKNEVKMNCKNVYKNDKTKIQDVFNQMWILLINRLELSNPCDLHTGPGDVS